MKIYNSDKQYRRKKKEGGSTWYENTGLTGEELEQTKKLLVVYQNERSDFFKEVSTLGEGFSGELSETFLGTDLRCNRPNYNNLWCCD